MVWKSHENHELLEYLEKVDCCILNLKIMVCSTYCDFYVPLFCCFSLSGDSISYTFSISPWHDQHRLLACSPCWNVTVRPFGYNTRNLSFCWGLFIDVWRFIDHVFVLWFNILLCPINLSYINIIIFIFDLYVTCVGKGMWLKGDMDEFDAGVLCHTLGEQRWYDRYFSLYDGATRRIRRVNTHSVTS